MSHDRVHVERVELEPEATPACALRGDHRGPTAQKSIEHYVAARGAVQDSVGYHPHTLRCGMHPEQVAFLAQSTRTRITPNIRAVAAVLAEHDIVAMRRAAVLVHKDQLVTAPVEGAHAGM